MNELINKCSNVILQEWLNDRTEWMHEVSIQMDICLNSLAYYMCIDLWIKRVVLTDSKMSSSYK